MEQKIEDELKLCYNDRILIECKSKKIRVYTIYLEIDSYVMEFDYIWDSTLTFEANIACLKINIDRNIINLFRR